MGELGENNFNIVHIKKIIDCTRLLRTIRTDNLIYREIYEMIKKNESNFKLQYKYESQEYHESIDENFTLHATLNYKPKYQKNIQLVEKISPQHIIKYYLSVDQKDNLVSVGHTEKIPPYLHLIDRLNTQYN